VRAQRADLLLDALLRARADRDHDDDGADADDDAEHGKRAAQLVDRECAQRHAKELQRAHTAIAAAATGRCDSSDTRCPSRKRSSRRPKRATSASCVTSTTVMPWRFSSWNSAMISTLVWSRALRWA